jgi:tetratricopeptide (TPR) repeat protein
MIPIPVTASAPIPLVGRETELATLRSVYERAVSYHAPQLVTVVGHQGTGKSRLVGELAASLPAAARVFRGRAEAGARYAAIASLLRDRVGGDSDAAFRAAVEQVFGDARVGDLTWFLGTLAGLRGGDSPFLGAFEGSAEQADAIARAVFKRFVDLDAAAAPLVLVLDDLDVADDATLDLVEELAEGLAGAPVVLVCCARSELLVRRPGFGQAAGDTTRIELRNLPPPVAGALLRQLLTPCGPVPDELVEDAVAMTGGNPHHLEEWVKLCVAEGALDIDATPWRLDAVRAAAVELPISVAQAIEARIAALGATERDLLEKASIFGNVFWVSGIVALTRLEQARGGGDDATAHGGWHDDGLVSAVLRRIERLAEKDYVLALPPEDSSIRGDVEVVFKHNLERELVFTMIDAARRKRYHRVAAQWLEVKLADRPQQQSEEQLEFLGQLHEGGGDGRRAALAFIAAGDKARLGYANGPAVELYKRALALLDEDDVLPRLDALHNLGTVLVLVGKTDEAADRFYDMLRLAWLFDHPAKAGAAHGRIGRIYRQRGDYETALAHFRQARELFERAQDRRGVAGALDDAGTVVALRGDYPAALEQHREALAIRRTLGDKRSTALSLANIGRVQLDMGAFTNALERFREALELRRAAGDRPGVVASMIDLGAVHEADGRLESAYEVLADALKLAKEIGDRQGQARVLLRAGEVLLALGRPEDAAEALDRANEIATGLGDRVGQIECGRTLAEVQLALGRHDVALEHARQALELAEKLGSRVHIGTANRVLAEVVAAGDLSDGGAVAERAGGADALFQRAIHILGTVANDLELARCYRAFADFRERLGDAPEAVSLRLRADEIFGRLRGAASQGSPGG